MRHFKSLLLTACLLPSLASLAQIEDYTLPDGKVVKIDAEELSEGERRQHRGLCYESSDTSIATVDKNGYITMVSKGTCDIWVYAQNGCYSTIKLLVK